MVKSYKTFIKEYSMGLQVPSTSYLKGVGSLQKQTKKQTSTKNTAIADATPALVITLSKKNNEVTDRSKGKVLDRKIKRMNNKV